MAWPDDLPLLLAGPIVRRAEPGLTSVWVALSEECTVHLSLWDGLVDAGTGGGVFAGPGRIAEGVRRTRRVGERLHVAVVTARPDNVLRPDTTYSYNVAFAPAGGSVEDLKSRGLLLDDPPSRLPLGYAGPTAQFRAAASGAGRSPAGARLVPAHQ